MGDVVNLRMKRKAKARAERDREADQNRLRHGRTLAEREARERADALQESRLDGHRLSSDET